MKTRTPAGTRPKTSTITSNNTGVQPCREVITGCLSFAVMRTDDRRVTRSFLAEMVETTAARDVQLGGMKNPRDEHERKYFGGMSGHTAFDARLCYHEVTVRPPMFRHGPAEKADLEEYLVRMADELRVEWRVTQAKDGIIAIFPVINSEWIPSPPEMANAQVALNAWWEGKRPSGMMDEENVWEKERVPRLNLDTLSDLRTPIKFS